MDDTIMIHNHIYQLPVAIRAGLDMSFSIEFWIVGFGQRYKPLIIGQVESATRCFNTSKTKNIG